MTIAEQLLEEGCEEGFAKGWEEGFQKGWEEEFEKGWDEGRLAALRIVLSSRFGSQARYAIYDAHLQFATAVEVGHYLQRVGVVDSLAAVFQD